MSKPKIIFIINAIQQQRCLKRIDSFIANGYDVEAYGFSRSRSNIPTPPHFTIHVLDYFDDQVSYAARVVRMYRALRTVFRKYRSENVLFYYFLLDVALVCRLTNHHPYIYEESDLMQTYLPRPLCTILNWIDRRIIRKSLLSVFTSEGFLDYHYANRKRPQNTLVLPNKLNPTILQYPPAQKEPIDVKHLRISFVGHARFKSLVYVAECMLKNFPKHQVHFYGDVSSNKEEYDRLKHTYDNVHFHGAFSNPKDLPSIYAQTDLVLATYDTHFANVRYAEPNKLYEAAYFETPIIVSSCTFLAKRVTSLGIGYVIDPWNEKQIIECVQSLDSTSIERCITCCRTIDKSTLTDDSSLLFEHPALKSYTELYHD